MFARGLVLYLAYAATGILVVSLVVLQRECSEPRSNRGALHKAMLNVCKNPDDFTPDDDRRTNEEKLETERELLQAKTDRFHLSQLRSWYQRVHPYATDPVERGSALRIGSGTQIQPLNWQWLLPGDRSFRWCSNLAPWMQCVYERNITKETHAVLLHPRHIGQDGLPTTRWPHQKWIFYETEAPTNVWNYVDPSEEYWKLFNITSTFTWDSDIPNHHHRFSCIPKPNWTPRAVNHAAGKTGKVAWFVSHCETSSRRELYVEELKKYIDVDIFGKCGKPMCDQPTENAAKCAKQLLDSSYKFYLSFENAFCSQYSTEKLSGILSSTVIPIVLGAYDYNNILPSGTFINVKDYKSPEQLAKYLRYLDTNDDEFNKYIAKKESYDCKRNAKANWQCQICEYLHLHRHEEQVVTDAASFWSVQQRCISPQEFYRGTADMLIDKINFTVQPDIFL